MGFADLLAAALAGHRTTIRAEWDAQPAAVLIPLYALGGEWHALYTRRTDDVEAHRGQVSFPGGVVEPSDKDPRETALRESEEEIGLLRSDVQILGQLDPLLTVTQFQIVPFIGIMPWPYPLRLNSSEVAKAFGVPLSWLNQPAHLEVKKHKPFVPGPEIDVYYFQPYEDEIIWGATARITLQLLEIISRNQLALGE
jgi:8-oxo-dGTP pyrophosphatase MutT (NUDIX family)